MFLRFLRVIIVVIILALILSISSIYAINQKNWNKYQGTYNENIETQLDSYFKALESNLKNVIESHAYWTDAVEHLRSKDSEWLVENATSYIIDMGLFQTDYILIADERLDFVQETGGNLMRELLSRSEIINVIDKDVTVTFIAELNDTYMLVVASPLMNDELKEATGLYLCASYLDEKHLEMLEEHLTGEIKEISIVDHPTKLESNTRSDDMFIFYKILDKNTFIRVHADLSEFNRFFTLQQYHASLSIIIASLIVGVVMSVMVCKIVNRLKELIYAVEEISEGDYQYKVKTTSSKYYLELNQLSTCINKMSDDIERHLTVIDEGYNDMVDVIINAVEINDAYTSKHNVEVGKYAKVIAEEINYEYTEDLVIASKLHDIGKIAVPSHILNKPGKLTQEEYEVIKIHPLKGYQIIEHLEYFNRIKLGVKYHHEHYDGTGYPEGLVGDEIPMIAQIISIADVYDALTSDRSYRKGMSHHQAVEIIQDESGKLFNPKLVKAFMRRREDFRVILIENRTHR